MQIRFETMPFFESARSATFFVALGETLKDSLESAYKKALNKKINKDSIKSFIIQTKVFSSADRVILQGVESSKGILKIVFTHAEYVGGLFANVETIGLVGISIGEADKINKVIVEYRHTSFDAYEKPESESPPSTETITFNLDKE
jgi:hypothetical protein